MLPDLYAEDPDFLSQYAHSGSGAGIPLNDRQHTIFRNDTAGVHFTGMIMTRTGHSGASDQGEVEAKRRSINCRGHFRELCSCLIRRAFTLLMPGERITQQGRAVPIFCDNSARLASTLSVFETDIRRETE